MLNSPLTAGLIQIAFSKLDVNYSCLQYLLDNDIVNAFVPFEYIELTLQEDRNLCKLVCNIMLPPHILYVSCRYRNDFRAEAEVQLVGNKIQQIATNIKHFLCAERQPQENKSLMFP